MCLFFLKDDTLGYRQNEVMADLLGVVKQMHAPASGTWTSRRILSRLTAFFRDRDNEFLLMRFQCYEAIGVAIGEAGNVKAADHLIEDILYWRFQYPEISGATDEWETVVNPYHLPKIRCWMHIIESNPALYERLAAALNVQLRLGGVYIADTDLFQRDVTRFLNADIRPIYFVAKQLLRTLPVYFNEVGAEGELRAVSTQIDEICGRRDTLMHFLRKQLHAESSNRMVPFCRAVLRYWLTLEPSGLEPFLSANTMAMVRGERGVGGGPPRDLLALRAACRAARAEARRVARRASTRPCAGAAPATAARSELEEFLDELLALRPATRARSTVGRARRGEPARRRRDRTVTASRSWCAPTSWSPTSTPCRPTTWAPRSAGTGSSEAKVRRAVRSGLWPRGRRARSRRPRATACSTRPSTCCRTSRRSSSAPTPSAATENIYQKRHIAAGIPSIYGNYSEPKFDALGLSLRVENLVGQAPRGPRRGGRRALRDACLAAPHGHGHRALRAGAVDRRRRFARPGRQPGSARGQLQQPQLHLRPVSERVPVPREQRDRALHDVDPQPRPGACTPCSPTTRASARRGACRWTRSPRWSCARCSSSALGMQALDRYAAAALRQIAMLNGRLGVAGAHAHDELRPRAARLADPQAQGRHRRPV